MKKRTPELIIHLISVISDIFLSGSWRGSWSIQPGQEHTLDGPTFRLMCMFLPGGKRYQYFINIIFFC